MCLQATGVGARTARLLCMVCQVEYMDARVAAQDMYIADLEHSVRELQRIVDQFRRCSYSVNGQRPDDLCDVLLPSRRLRQPNTASHQPSTQ